MEQRHIDFLIEMTKSPNFTGFSAAQKNGLLQFQFPKLQGLSTDAVK